MKIFCDAPDTRIPQLKCNKLLPCPVHQPETARSSRLMAVAAEPLRGCYSQGGYIFGVSIGDRWLAIEQKFLH